MPKMHQLSVLDTEMEMLGSKINMSKSHQCNATINAFSGSRDWAESWNLPALCSLSFIPATKVTSQITEERLPGLRTRDDNVWPGDALGHMRHVTILGQVSLQEACIADAVAARILQTIFHCMLVGLNPVHLPAL